MSEKFYSELKTYSNFNDSFEKENYYPVPDDWYVIITDVKDSTIAINSGKYKDVNLIGSACIGTVVNEGDFPFVFGGDGASFLIPPEKLEKIKSELLKIKNSAKNRYSLELRIGIVPVRTIIEKFEIRVAKHELAPGRYIAKFSGGGLFYADQLIKSDSNYLVESLNLSEESSFNRISCRWNPIKSQQGVILTIMLKTDSFEDYKNLQNALDQILGQDETKLNPVKPNKMSYLDLSDIYKNESKYEAHFFSLSSIKRKIEILIAFLIFKPLKYLYPKLLHKYTQSMQTHSDYRKFDDILRMVIDCSEEQVKAIIEVLDQIPNLVYGHSCSKNALMTCLVFSLDEGEHIHFIDGADGGYTQAAKVMKHKMSTIKEA